MYIVHVDSKDLPARLLRQLHHPVEVHEEREEDLVTRWTVLLDACEVRLERDCGHITGMKCEGGSRGEGVARGGGQCPPYRRVWL